MLACITGCMYFEFIRDHPAIKRMLDLAVQGIVDNIDQLPLDMNFNVRTLCRAHIFLRVPSLVFRRPTQAQSSVFWVAWQFNRLRTRPGRTSENMKCMQKGQFLHNTAQMFILNRWWDLPWPPQKTNESSRAGFLIYKFSFLLRMNFNLLPQFSN